MSASPNPVGTLYLVPAPLDFGCSTQSPLAHSLPSETLRIAAGLQHWICENAKSTRAYLKRIAETHPLSLPLQSLDLQELPREVHKKGDHLPDHGKGVHAAGRGKGVHLPGQGPGDSTKGGPVWDARAMLKPALVGNAIGLISEAGMPAIADPGSSIVRAAHDLGIPVVPLVGPVSLLLALAASGLNGQNFAFVGYVPSAPAERAQRIRELETLALKTGQTQLFIETPYRNEALLQTLLQSLQHNTRLATASGLTLGNAEIHSGFTKQWKADGWALRNDTPTVFGIGR